MTAAPAFARSAKGASSIDTHAHVFRRDLPLAERRRYAVDYDASPDAYMKMLGRNGMRRGVLIQPSFLGFDNSYLLDVLRLYPERLRGIVALERDTSADTMAGLKSRGVMGVRLNLIGRSDPDLANQAWRRHLAAVANLGWQIELQCEAARLPALLPPLLDSGTAVVIDHFGRPQADLGIYDPGFRYLVGAASKGRLYVKLSAPYRTSQAAADAAAPVLLDAFGPTRLLWGSDWPHTQFESVADARRVRHDLDRWVPDRGQRAAILTTTPAALFGFDTAPVASSLEEAR